MQWVMISPRPQPTSSSFMPGTTVATSNASCSRLDRCSPSDSMNTSNPSQAVKKYSSVYKSESNGFSLYSVINFLLRNTAYCKWRIKNAWHYKSGDYERQRSGDNGGRLEIMRLEIGGCCQSRNLQSLNLPSWRLMRLNLLSSGLDGGREAVRRIVFLVLAARP